MINKTRLLIFLIVLTAVTALSITSSALPPATAAGGTTFFVSSSSCTGTGSFVEAVTLANDNPGHDTISFDPDLQIEASELKCPPVGNDPSNYYIAQVTESVTIEGNGAIFKGRLGWVNTSGTINPTDVCPAEPTIVIARTPGFLKVGLFGQSNTGLTVEVKNLELIQFNAIAQVEQDASLELEDFTAKEIYSVQDCRREAINAAQGASVSLRRNDWEKIYSWALNGSPPIPGVPLGPSIVGGPGAGDLHIEDSRFRLGKEDGFIYWVGESGSEVNIVTSTMERVKAIVVDGEARTRIVNSVFALEASQGNTDHEERIYNLSTQDMDIIASTFLFPNAVCGARCQQLVAQGGIYATEGLIVAYDGKINFQATAIGVALPFEGDSLPGELLDTTYGQGRFTADQYTWIQPVLQQDSAALKTLTAQSNLLTDPPGLPTAFDNSAIADSWSVWATPLVPGLLLDVISDADCGGTNQLINPIDGTCIDKDILGNSRWDTGNNRRNIGAVQLTLAPHLQVTATGDGTVDLAWSRPLDPPGGTITGYAVLYRPAGSSDPFTRVDVPGADMLTGTISSLTNGEEYEFKAVAVTSLGDGPPSNLVKATPYATIDPPEVTAVPGDRQVELFWIEPDAGGHPGPLVYTVLYRQVGTNLWVTGPREILGRITLIPGLTNNKEYEFAVFATATNGTVSELAKTTATPFKSVPPPEPGTENCTLSAGYWSSHSEYGPSLYDSTWAKLANGADTPFFLSSQSYYEVINTPPQGNAYYNLAHQYIAAELNFLRGADPADVQSTFAAATQLFNNYTPDAVKDLEGPAREEWTDLATILDDYSNGYIGPGYCAE